MIVETSIGVDFDLFFQTSYDLPRYPLLMKALGALFLGTGSEKHIVPVSMLITS